MINNFKTKLFLTLIATSIHSDDLMNPTTYSKDLYTEVMLDGNYSNDISHPDEFLEFSKSVGNNLSDPVPEYNFSGVLSGDRWCLCAERWKQAYFSNKAPKVILESTNILTLSVIEFSILKKFSY